MITGGKPVAASRSTYLTGIALSALGASFFSLKGVLMKLAYAEGGGVEQMMALRMAFAVPIFLVVGWITARKKFGPTPWRAIAPRRVFFAMMMGVLAYNICTWLDFQGLQYISAQLERLILFIYPTFVALLAWGLHGEKITWRHLMALALSYGGVSVLALSELLSATPSSGADPLLGGGLVLLCAVLFAVYVISIKGSISELGAPLFTSISMTAASFGIFAFVALLHIAGAPIPPMTPNILLIGAALGLVCTVAPGFLVAEAISRIGPGLSSAVGGVGPAVAAIAAVILLNEPFGWPQVTALALSVTGVLFLSGANRTER